MVSYPKKKRDRRLVWFFFLRVERNKDGSYESKRPHKREDGMKRRELRYVIRRKRMFHVCVGSWNELLIRRHEKKKPTVGTRRRDDPSLSLFSREHSGSCSKRLVFLRFRTSRSRKDARISLSRACSSLARKRMGSLLRWNVSTRPVVPLFPPTIVGRPSGFDRRNSKKGTSFGHDSVSKGNIFLLLVRFRKGRGGLGFRRPIDDCVCV